MKGELLRGLPKIDDLLKEDSIHKELERSARHFVLQALREAIDIYRKGIIEERVVSIEKEEILELFFRILFEKKKYSFEKVINATGTVVHTNLGRSVLSKSAINHVVNTAENYSNLEYEIESGTRGSRYTHVEKLLTELTGAEAALVVNNNAAAVILVLNTLCKGKEAIVSRGQLVEIGGSFRIPDVMSFSGASLAEVGTTNKTHLYDYENRISEHTGVILKVHTSNYRIVGFTEEVSTEELTTLGRKRGVPVVEDIGSGVLIDFSKYGLSYEPTVQESIQKGIDVVTFSGDKMLGGPQAGIIVGKKEWIAQMKKNQLTRALRIDKMTLAAIEATLRLYLDEAEAVKNIPTLHMLLSDKEEHKKRAQRLKRKITAAVKGLHVEVAPDFSVVGGGAMPLERVATYVLKINSEQYSAKEIESYLRKMDPPIIVRIYHEAVVMDLRTLFDKDLDVIAEAFAKIHP